MEIELILGAGGVLATVLFFFWQMKSDLEGIKKEMHANFERHREEHQEHHKEIAKMFEASSTSAYEHYKENAVQLTRIEERQCHYCCQR